MAVGSPPDQARAVAAFNPTAPEPGFLQPLLVGLGGDNRTYIQIFSAPDRLIGFEEVSWPDRDFMGIDDGPLLTIGAEPLWGFLFPDEAPLAQPWSEFRSTMQERIGDPKLAQRPLLLFDIVDTLDLESAKPEIFTRAYRAYAELGDEAAARWRDRAILEPALARILPRLGLPVHRTTVMDIAAEGRPVPRLRARSGERDVIIHVEGTLGEKERSALQREYERLAEQLPDLFARDRSVIASPPPRRTGPPPTKTRRITVVLVGRLARGYLSRERSVAGDVEVVEADSFHPTLRVAPASGAYVLCGAQSDWPELAEVASRMGDLPAFVVFISTTAAPLVRDLEYQSSVTLATVAFFAPYATSTTAGRDPVATIRPMIEMVQAEISSAPSFIPATFFPAQHNLLLREPGWADQDAVELACRLAARAIKAGAVLDGGATLHRQGLLARTDPAFWHAALSRLFRMDAEGRAVGNESRRSSLMLLVERISRDDPDEQRDRMADGIRRLFELRGWRILGGHDRSFDIEADTVPLDPHAMPAERRMSVLVVESVRDLPVEDPSAPSPGLTRAPLLVIHVQSRREALLLGNRGQFFHAAVEDIALMAPGAPWVWSVLRRQLFDARVRLSSSALRLCGSLVLQALRTGRANSHVLDIKTFEDIIGSPNWDRFVSFVETRPRNSRIMLAITSIFPFSSGRKHMLAELRIDDSGPIVELSVTR